MKPVHPSRHRAFTLLETVIAIGVLSVLLTGFIVVFTPAADGIRKSLNLQQADRMASAVEQELVTLRKGNEADLPVKTPPIYTGFDKAFDWIKKSNAAANAVLVYQYRGEVGGTLRLDGTPKPVRSLTGKQPGKDYVMIPMCRRVSDTLFKDETTGDISAVEGAVYLVKCTQLVFSGGQLVVGTAGKIIDPKGTTEYPSADTYPEAVIAFSADFYTMPAKTASYFTSSASSAPKAFIGNFANFKNPVFSRNLAVRR